MKAKLICLILSLVIIATIFKIAGWGYLNYYRHIPMVSFPQIGWATIHQYDPDLMWALIPNIHCEVPAGSGLYITTNSLGLRSPELKPKGNQRRILCLGASTTFGAGVDDSQTWPSQLQKLLDSRNLGKYEVINAGVSAYSAFQGLQYFEKKGLILEPDIVLICFGHNDCWDIPPSGMRDCEWENPEKYGGLVILWKQALHGMGIGLPAYPSGRPNKRISYGEYYDIIERMRKLCFEKKIIFLFIIWPYEEELIHNTVHETTILTRALHNATGTTILDLNDIFKNAQEKVFSDGLHATIVGNSLVAKEISNYFQ